MPLGYWCPVLHAHLPYVRHPEHADFLEEDWFYEALTETYVPLARMLDRLAGDGVPVRLTMTLSPTLLSMMQDALLLERYRRWLDRLLALAEREVTRTAAETPRLEHLARFYVDELGSVREVFRGRHGSDLVRAFRRHRDEGRLEILTCAATHAVLPLVDGVGEAVRAQVRVGADHYRRVLGRDPVGIWLPECAYQPGHERYLREAGLRYTFLEAHGLTDARPRPSHGVLAPVVSPGGVAFFGRDTESSRQVWSAEVGYPGHPEYREFYRDVGFDLPPEALGDALPGGARKCVGIKYHRITGRGTPLSEKAPYRPVWAAAQAERHATHFLARLQERAVEDSKGMARPPLVVSPYDAELFGHWWYEGPVFLESLFRQMEDQGTVACVTPSEFLGLHPECEVAQPSLSTWGAKGYAGVWLDPANDWIYPHLDAAAERMVALARRFERPSPLERRALAQAARELLLAQSSDWAFMMKMGTTVEYASSRFRSHVARFTYLHERLVLGEVDEPVLRHLEERDNLFPALDARVYR